MYEALTIGTELEGEDARRWKRHRIMGKMGWSYREYRETPASIIEETWMFILTEAKAISDSRPRE